MKRHALFLIVLLFGTLSLFGCVMTPEEEVETTEEVAGISCKGQCVQILVACLRAAETDEDRAECVANRDACVADCEDCGDPAPCPFPD